MANNFITYGFQKEALWIDTSSVWGSFALNSTTVKIAFVFTTEEACTIDTIALRVNTQTYTSGSGAYKVGIAGYSNGAPTTYLNNAYKVLPTYTTNALNGKMEFHTLNNSYTCTKGETLAILIEYDSGTIDANNFTNFTITNTAWSINRAFPVYLTYNGSSWTRGNTMPIYGYGSSTKMYGNLVSESTLSANKTDVFMSAAINMPTGTCNSYKIGGVQYMLTSTDTAGDTYRILLVDTSFNILQSITIDTDFMAGSTSRAVHHVWFDRNNLATLSPNTTYYLGLQYISGTAFGVVCNGYIIHPTNTVDYGLKANNRNNLYGFYSSAVPPGVTVEDFYYSPYIYPIITDIS